MSQYRVGSVTVTQGATTVTGSGTGWKTDRPVLPGHTFSLRQSGVTYTVAAVDSDTQLTLSAPYAGATAVAQAYVINRDFTPYYNIPYPGYGDIDTAELWKQAVLRIEQAIVEQDTGLNVIESRVATAPPATPSERVNYIVPAGATGIWAGQTNRIAVWDNDVWKFIEPREGWRVYVRDEAYVDYIFDDGAWRPGPQIGEAVIAAAAFRDEARAWATKTDGPVVDDEYSARHHAEQAATIVGTITDEAERAEAAAAAAASARDQAAAASTAAQAARTGAEAAAADATAQAGQAAQAKAATETIRDQTVAERAAAQAARAGIDADKTLTNAAKTAAEAAASTATTKAGEATTAAASATTRAAEATAARDKAQQWAERMDGPVEGAGHSAKKHATDADASATAAAGSATTAGQKADAAAGSAASAAEGAGVATAKAAEASAASSAASAAALSADTARAGAQQAEIAAETAAEGAAAALQAATNKATVATGAADTASNAATAASAAASNATDASANASTSAQSAAAAAQTAADHREAALDAKTGAEIARDAASATAANVGAIINKAQQWAEAQPNTEVEPGKFSSRHWAGVAESFADQAATIVGGNTWGVFSQGANYVAASNPSDRLELAGTRLLFGFNNITKTLSIINPVKFPKAGASASIGITALDNEYEFELTATGVTPGGYKQVVVDAYGRVTAGSNPTTLNEFGITNAYTKTEIDTAIGAAIATRIALNSDTSLTGGVYRFTNPAGATLSPAWSTARLEVFQNTPGADAFMAFHINGDIAAYFGLDGTTNDLAYGGWSHGNAKHRVWHAGNDGAGSGLDADLLDGQHGSYYAPKDSPILTGSPSAPTPASGTNTTQIATTAFVNSAVNTLNAAVAGYYAPLSSPTLTGTPSAPTASAGTSTTQIATTAFVRGEVASLVGTAPATLDTLNELATALGNDPNFATTVTTALSGKANLTGATFTGGVHINSPGADLRLSQWGEVGGEVGGQAWIGSNLHYDAAAGTWKTPNGHATIGYRGIAFNAPGWGDISVTSFSGATTQDAPVTPEWNKLWHAGNDGSGSGLDADLLDGVQLSALPQLAAQNTYTGTASFTWGEFGTPTIWLKGNHQHIRLGDHTVLQGWPGNGLNGGRLTYNIEHKGTVGDTRIADAPASMFMVNADGFHLRRVSTGAAGSIIAAYDQSIDLTSAGFAFSGAMMSVKATSPTAAALHLEQSNTTDGYRLTPNASSGHLQILRYAGGAETEVLRLDGNRNLVVRGNALIGTTRSSNIEVGASGGAHLRFRQDGADDVVDIVTHKSGVRHSVSATFDQNGHLVLPLSDASIKFSDGTSVTAGAGALKVNGNPVWHSGNFNPASYLPTTGATGVTLNGPTHCAIEIGRTDGNGSTPYIDFHSGSTPTDYDARILVSGGNGTIGQGTLNYTAAAHQFSGNVNVAGTFTVNGLPVSGSGLPTTEHTSGPQAMATKNAYIANGAAQIKYTLPATSALGDEIVVIGKGSGGWAINQGPGQYIRYSPNSMTTVGAFAGIMSSEWTACVRLVCTEANLGWTVASNVGTFAAYQPFNDWAEFNASILGNTTTLTGRGDDFRSVKINSQYSVVIYSDGVTGVRKARVMSAQGLMVSAGAEQSLTLPGYGTQRWSDPLRLLDGSNPDATRLLFAYCTENVESHVRIALINVNCSSGVISLVSTLSVNPGTSGQLPRPSDMAVLSPTKAVMGDVYGLHGIAISGDTISRTNTLTPLYYAVSVGKLSGTRALARGMADSRSIVQVVNFADSQISLSGTADAETGINYMVEQVGSRPYLMCAGPSNNFTDWWVRLVTVDEVGNITMQPRVVESPFSWSGSHFITQDALMYVYTSGNNIFGRIHSLSASNAITLRNQYMIFAGSQSTYPTIKINPVDANYCLLMFQDGTNGALKARVLKRA